MKALLLHTTVSLLTVAEGLAADDCGVVRPSRI